MPSIRTLIIIPGLLAVPIWKHLGYAVHIFSFGLEDANEDFPTAIKRLVGYIDHLRAKRVNIIGVSAGGTVLSMR